MVTKIFYVTVVALATLTAFLSYRKGETAEVGGVKTVIRAPQIRRGGLVVTFALMWYVLAISSCGADYESYNSIFINATSITAGVSQYTVELGFSLYNYIIRLFTNNIVVYNFITAFIYLFLIFVTLYRLKDRIHFGWAIMAVSCIFYLQFMDLKRIYLAAAICFFAVPYIINKKPWKALACLLVSVMIHTTSIIAIAPMLMYWICERSYKIGKREIKIRWWYFAIVAIFALGAAYLLREQITEIFAGSRYGHYEVLDGNVGIAQIIYHAPILLLLIRKKKFLQDKLVKYSIFCLIGSFVISSMGYFIQVIGRTFVYFMIPFVFVMSLDNVYRDVADRGNIKKKIFRLMLCAVGVGYFAMRLYVYLETMLVIDKIIPYTTIFYWTI